MEGYAQAAVDVAHSEFEMELDFSSDSVDVLDDILVVVSESPERDLDFEVRLWGSYLGEVLRRRYAGGWEMTQYPGRNGGRAGCGCAWFQAVSADEGLPQADCGRRGRFAQLLHHGDGAAGTAGASELNTGAERELSAVSHSAPSSPVRQ